MEKENKFLSGVKVVIMASILAFGLQYAAAQTAPSWQAPTSAPPSGNTYAPLNVGSSYQFKDGGLVVGNTLSESSTALFVPSGRVNIGVGPLIPAIKFHMQGAGNQRLMVESSDTNAARLEVKNNGNNAWHIQAWRSMFGIVESDVATRVAIGKGSGNVSIGAGDSVDPVAKLLVNGQVKISGGAPGAGKVLTSDANGLATWQAAPGGGATVSGPGQYVPVSSAAGSPQDVRCPEGKVMTGLKLHDWDTNNTSLRVQGIYCNILQSN